MHVEILINMCMHAWYFASVVSSSLQPKLCQASLSMGFSRQEHWSGLPCPPPRYVYTHLKTYTHNVWTCVYLYTYMYMHVLLIYMYVEIQICTCAHTHTHTIFLLSQLRRQKQWHSRCNKHSQYPGLISSTILQEKKPRLFEQVVDYRAGRYVRWSWSIL